MYTCRCTYTYTNKLCMCSRAHTHTTYTHTSTQHTHAHTHRCTQMHTHTGRVMQPGGLVHKALGSTSWYQKPNQQKTPPRVGNSRNLYKCTFHCHRCHPDTDGLERMRFRMLAVGKEENRPGHGNGEIYYVYIRKTDLKPIIRRSLTFPERTTRNC